MEKYLGMLSAQFESNGDPGCIANTPGDAGGKSVGAYQFANNAGVIRAFINWLRDQGHKFGRLADYDTDTDEFDAEWKVCAEEDRDEFWRVQHEYVGMNYYNRAVERVRECYINIEKHSFALQNVLWSASVQYGVYYTKELFEDACDILGYPNPSYVDSIDYDQRVIEAIYTVRKSDEWTSGSPSLRYGLRRRFTDECEEALKLLQEEVGSYE